MKKEDILKKYKEEEIDEGQAFINQFGDDKGFYALCGLALVLMIFKLWMNQPFGDIISLLLIFLSVGGFYRYKKTSSKADLSLALFSGFLCLLSLAWYIMDTVLYL